MSAMKNSSVDPFEAWSSEDARDDTDADSDFEPGTKAVKKRKSGRNRSGATPRVSNRTPKASRKAATTAPPTNNQDLASAISHKARLPHCKLGAVELVTFFPHHFQWPETGLRLYRNHWKSQSIAKAMLHARNKLDYRSDQNVEKRRAALRHLVINNGKYFFNDENFTPSASEEMTEVATYDASVYAPRHTYSTANMFDAKLVDIAKGVVNWPQGEDRGIVTQAIAYAVNNRRKNLTTADVPRLAAQEGFQDPADSFGSQWDQNAQDRSEARIELTGNYRKERFKEAYESDSESE